MMDIKTKKCPMCAEEIPLAADTCPYCEARFEVISTGYCQTCHDIQPGDGNGNCRVCGSPVLDWQVKSSFIEDVSQEPVQIELPISPVPKAGSRNTNRLWGWMGGIIMIAIIAAWLWFKPDPAPVVFHLDSTLTPTQTASRLPGSTTTLTQKPLPTLTFTPTEIPTKTPRPTSTVTPLPAWVTDFAQPILTAISERPPNFQDDFGTGSGGWQADDWCGQRMDHVEGELVVTDCRVSRPKINYPDFVIEFDARFFPGAASGSYWAFVFRDTGGPNHALRIDYGGSVMLSFYEGGTYEFPAAANPGNQTNHVLVIGKDSNLAVYINSEPIFNINAPQPRYGDFRFFADDTILAIDNLKIWDIANNP
jgi:hypothetical protein